MTIKFYFPRYKTKKPAQTLFCRMADGGSELNLNTDCKVDPKYWDKSKQRINVRMMKDPIKKNTFKNINKILEAYENKIEEIEMNVRAKNLAANFYEIKEAISEHFNPSKSNSLFDHYNEFVETKSIEVSKEALQKYSRVKTLLIEFEKSTRDSLNFDKITPLFFDKFFPFLIYEKGMLNNTAHKTIQFLKTFLI